MIPTKLKIVLINWAIIGGIYTLSMWGLMIAAIIQSLTGDSSNPFPFNIVAIFFVFLVSLIGVYLLKICFDLWHGKSYAEFPLRIYTVLGLLVFPIGTILGIYTLTTLSSEDVKVFLNKGQPPMTKEKLVEEVGKLKNNG